MKEIVISKDELQIVTNSLFDSDKRYFRVKYPFYDLELFNLDIQKPEMKNIVQKSDFDSAALGCRIPDLDSKQMVHYHDLRECLLSSTVIPFSNLDEVIQKLMGYSRDFTDPSVMPRPFVLAVDTNVLYFRFISRHLMNVDDPMGVSLAHSYRYVLSELVKSEIDAQIKHKYSMQDMAIMRKAFSNNELLKEFVNGSDLLARKAKQALNEAEFLQKRLGAHRIPVVEHSRDRELNDQIIADSYSNWVRENHYDCCLLTADEDMLSHAIKCELRPIQLLMPSDLPKHIRVDPWRLSELLFDLSTTFGVISIENEARIHLFGEWGGKTAKQSFEESLKLRIEDEVIHQTICQDIDACRSIIGN